MMQRCVCTIPAAASSVGHLISAYASKRLDWLLSEEREFTKRLNYRNRNLHNHLLQRHIMPAICRELEFILVLSRYGDATQQYNLRPTCRLRSHKVSLVQAAAATHEVLPASGNLQN